MNTVRTVEDLANALNVIMRESPSTATAELNDATVAKLLAPFNDILPVVRFGCHCDLDPDMEPDGCVLDEDKPQNCIYAKMLLRDGKAKRDCSEWKPVSVVTKRVEVRA